MALRLDVETTRARESVCASSSCGRPADQLPGPGFYDVILRDIGLSSGASALARLSQEFKHPMAGSISHGS